MTSDEYREYLESPHWRALSKYFRESVGACEECGITDTLNVHHKHYRTLGDEQRNDVRVLCERCHMNTHILQDRMKMFGISATIGKSFVEKRDYVQMEINNKRLKRDPMEAVLMGMARSVELREQRKRGKA